MNSAQCCPRHTGGLSRHCRDVLGWLVPTAILAALPKCPLCIAVYVALGTGFGISLSTAAHIRMFVITLCTALLALAALRQIRLVQNRTERAGGSYFATTLKQSASIPIAEKKYSPGARG